jgi:hypothetical protein
MRNAISRQMALLPFFRCWLKMPIEMEKDDRLEYARNPLEPYAYEEIVAMERRAKGEFNLLVRLALQYREKARRMYHGAVFEAKKEIPG